MNSIILLSKLINDYENQLKSITEYDYDLSTLQNILFNKDMERGVCFYSFRNYDTSIFEENWIKEYNLKGDRYWTQIPRDCRNIQQIKLVFKTRIEILKKIYNEQKKNQDFTALG